MYNKNMKEDANEVLKHFTDLIEEAGTTIGLHSGQCVIHQLEKGGECVGCDYELGCRKMIKILAIAFTTYKITDYEESMKAFVAVNECVQKILTAQSIADLNNL